MAAALVGPSRPKVVFAGVIAEIFVVIESTFAPLKAVVIRTGAGPPVGRLCFEQTIRMDLPCRVMTHSPGSLLPYLVVHALTKALEHLDDDHASAAAWAWRAHFDRLIGCVVSGRRGSVQEFAGAGDASRLIPTLGAHV